MPVRKRNTPLHAAQQKKSGFAQHTASHLPPHRAAKPYFFVVEQNLIVPASSKILFLLQRAKPDFCSEHQNTVFSEKSIKPHGVPKVSMPTARHNNAQQQTITTSIDPVQDLQTQEAMQKCEKHFSWFQECTSFLFQMCICKNLRVSRCKSVSAKVRGTSLHADQPHPKQHCVNSQSLCETIRRCITTWQRIRLWKLWNHERKRKDLKSSTPWGPRVPAIEFVHFLEMFHFIREHS